MYQIYKKLNQYTNARDNNLRIFKKGGHIKTKEQNKELAFKDNMWQSVYIVQRGYQSINTSIRCITYFLLFKY